MVSACTAAVFSSYGYESTLRSYDAWNVDGPASTVSLGSKDCYCVSTGRPAGSGRARGGSVPGGGGGRGDVGGS